MIIDYLIISIGLVWLIFASISDIKKREIPDWLNYSLIVIILGVYLISSLVYKQGVFFKPLIGFVIFFAIANFMYYTKQWGGGDAKLLMGMGALFAIYPLSLLKWFSPNLDFPLLVSFFINLVVIGAFYTLLFMVYLLIKNRNKVFKRIKLNYQKTKKSNKLSLMIGIIIILLSFLFPLLIKIILIMLVIATLLTIQIFIVSKAIESSTMIKSVLVKKLTEGDWVVDKKLKKKYKISGLGIEKEQIEMLKKSRIKEILIKEGTPFAPVFLISAVITWIFGSWWFFYF